MLHAKNGRQFFCCHCSQSYQYFEATLALFILNCRDSTVFINKPCYVPSPKVHVGCKVITYRVLRDATFDKFAVHNYLPVYISAEKWNEYTTFHFSAADQQFLGFIVPIIIQEKTQMWKQNKHLLQRNVSSSLKKKKKKTHTHTHTHPQTGSGLFLCLHAGTFKLRMVVMFEIFIQNTFMFPYHIAYAWL
jgi:hypothetical protein